MARLRLPPASELHVIVADNDAGGGALGICTELQREGLPGLACVVESERGLSNVRNRLLAEALRSDAGFIAFLDDDEQPHPDWLAAHLSALDSTGADASSGPVLQELPADAIDADAGKEICVTAGITPRFVACNNVVFRRHLADQQGLRFDPQFNFTGGEDFDFFESSRRRGNRHVWTPAARVFEPGTPARATIAYLFRRHCSGAMTRVLQERKWRAGPVWPRFLVKTCGKVLGSILCLLRALFPPHGPALREAVKRFASGCGYVCGLLHLRVERYR